MEGQVTTTTMTVRLSVLLVLLYQSSSSIAQSQQPETLAAATTTRQARKVAIEKTSLTTPGTGRLDFELGTIYVPENRADPKSRTIGVGFARFRALKSTGAPPIFLLPGGPGYSFV